MSAGETLPPEAWILEAGVERLDEVESLWRAMHEHHTELAREVTPRMPTRRRGNLCKAGALPLS